MNETRELDATSIAVVGMAGRFPGAGDVDAFWSNLKGGVESITFFTGGSGAEAGTAEAGTAEAGEAIFVDAAGVIDGEDLFDAAFFDFNPREAELTDPQQRLLLELAWQALEDAGCDPESFDGEIGVFAGVGLNTYFLTNVLGRPEVVRATPPLQLMIGTDKDYVASRIAYKLNLKGPAYSVQSACSTSLVAVHVACQNLLDHQCDLALAGGASIRVPQRTGYLYQEGGIYSPDGHCRPFDAGAAGTVPGSGAGIVALKRWEEAVADGDRVLAVIRGSAVNNDGNAKVGFTAPGVEGQVAVIAEALAASGVGCESITYVEAHGTGTVLGDPLEAAALSRAFAGDPRRRACALGSVKANVGHLDAAAGVAGLIKTVQALRHGQIPPTPHFRELHPEVDFGPTPFFVPARLGEWPADGGPRRAGVSSFGIGGTNAHVVIEEAPAPEPPAAARPFELLTLSARTAGALEAATEELARHLANHPEQDLADVGHTLRAGRKRFEHRRTLVCRDREDAATALAARDPERLRTAVGEAVERPVVFLFPGQGAQHPGMGRGLYETEPVFAREVDEAAALLEEPLGLDLRELLYPRPARAEEAARRLAATELAQPALFVVEYALARLWQAWGVVPAAMLGHSVGEYVAACLAGVLDRDDALALVAARGKLVGSLPPGAMLSVPLAESELAGLLSGRGELSLAAVNGPAFLTVSGPEPAIAELENELRGEGVEARRLVTSHAFHSAMMEPILEDFEAELRRRPLAAPRLPFLSNVSGTWITDGEAADPAYWVRHLRRTVRFGDGLAELFGEPDRVLLEVGPGRQLSGLARRHRERPREQTVLGSLPAPGGGERDRQRLLETLGRLWLGGVRIDWAGYAAGERRRKVALPTYPFERERYWLEPGGAAVRAAEAPAAEAPAAPAAAVPAGGGHRRPDLATEHVAPRDAVEERLAGIWSDALGLSSVGVHDDFFELGGDSLLATRIVSEARRAFAVDVPLAELLDRPTVAAMAAVLGAALERRAVETAEVEALPSVRPDPRRRGEPFPLTDVQQAYWIGRDPTFELGGVSTHVYNEFLVRDLDAGALNRAWRRLVERHDMLRAVVLPDGRQQILSEVPAYEIEVLDLVGRPRDEAAAALEELRRRLSQQVLPADRWPLFEVCVSRLEADLWRLHVSVDMLVADAWSLQILTRDLRRFYDDPHCEARPPGLSFRDYVLAARELERSAAFERDLEYWRGRLSTFPEPPELPLALDPAVLERPRFARLASHLDADAWRRLKERAAGAGLTPSGLLLAAFAEVLAVWSKGSRFALNLTLFNRLPLHPEVGELIGDFTSLTLLAVDNSGGEPFLERARRLQKRLWEDLDHRLVSAVRVLREMARARTPGRILYPVVFTSTLGMEAPGATGQQPPAGTAVPDDREGYAISQTPQVWIDHQVGEDRGVLHYNWDAVEDLFPEGLVREMFAAYGRLVRRLADGEEAWRERAPAGLPAAQLELRALVNDTAAPLPEMLLHQPFQVRARQRPAQPAVVAEDRTLAYGELARRSHALALELVKRGARPGRLVAVMMEKGWEQVVAVLAVLEAGGAYLPIDVKLPEKRRRHLLDTGRVRVVLTQARLAELVPGHLEALAVDRLAEAEGEIDFLEPAQGMDDLAYVIFTSGSTGEPKGVMIDHRGAANTCADVRERFAVGPGDRVLGVSALGFDLSVFDVFGTLSAGGTLVLPPADGDRDPAVWRRQMAEHGVTVWNSVPALMELLADQAEGRREPLPESLRLVLLSGDWIPVALPGRVRALAPRARVVSLGGATEASIWSIVHPVGEVAPDLPSIPYGRPMRNQTFHVLDHRLEPRPEWVPGELFIGGAGLARGYWRDEVKTAASFFPHPRTGERLYRTGDLGRYLPGGDLQFLGREDFQVKLRGYRVELGEIEAALGRHPGIREAVVVARAAEGGGRRAGAPPGPARLVAYVIPASDAAPESDELRDHLRELLPEYMVPARFLTVADWPLTANGKVDRRALPAPEEEAAGEADHGPDARPRNETEELLAEICRTFLGVESLGIHDDFFALGGDSLIATRIVFELRKEFEIELPVRSFFDAPTVAQLAEQVEEKLLDEIEALADEEVHRV